MKFKNELIKSLDINSNTLHSNEELFSFYEQKIKNSNNIVTNIGISELSQWNFDKVGNFIHESGRFFSVSTYEHSGSDFGILNQPDVGTLAVFSTFINETLHFLIQFKLEPGNINNYQLSPTIQATRSNHSRVHGGKLPTYWKEYGTYKNILFDSLLPEQGDRYWQKLNRNIVIHTNELPEEEGFKWMTLRQILNFSEYDNSLNSCLRSVLSLLFTNYSENNPTNNEYFEITKKINDYSEKNKGNSHLSNNAYKFYNKNSDLIEFRSDKSNFDIIGLLVESKDREVTKWSQPIIKECKASTYHQIIVKHNSEYFFVWSIQPHQGYILGSAYGPTFIDFFDDSENIKVAENLSKFNKLGSLVVEKNIKMSEEGGRFLHNEVMHRFYIYEMDDIEKISKEFELFNIGETSFLLRSGFLGIEARSILFFSFLFFQ